MSYQVPKDLIEQARILLRKEAGLESYNPSDTSFPSLPTVEEVIAGFDPSPESVRCKHCKGKLLRGSQSLVCVYCGREQKPEFPPEPISFKSTIGFRWLVDSLGLDGSEVVDLSDEDTQSKRGRNSVKDEISLSNFLDLEMKWPTELERFGLTDAEVSKNNGKRPFQLAGVDFSNSFSEEKSDKSLNPPIEQTMSNEKSREFEAFPVQGSLGLFENREYSGGVMKPSEGQNGDSWEADFQDASFVAAHEELQSSHPSQIPSVDYASHMDSVFGPLEDLKKGKSVDDSFSHAPYSIKETETDAWSNSLSGVSDLERKDDVNVLPDHREKGSELNSLSSVTANRLPENEKHMEALESVDSVKGVRDDSSNSWKDFKSATDVGKNQGLTSSTVVSTIDGNCDSSDVWNDFTGSTGSGDNRHQTSSLNAPEDDSFDAWNDFTGPVTVSDSQLPNRVVNSAEEKPVSVGNDMFGSWVAVTSLTGAQGSQHQMSDEIKVSTETFNHRDTVGLSSDHSSLAERSDKLQNTGTLPSADRMTKKDDDSFDLWRGFMDSTVAQHNPGESNGAKLAHDQLNGEGEDTADDWGDFMRLTNSGSSEQKIKSTETHVDNSISKDDDYSWNVVTSSAYGPESKSVNEDTARERSDISNPSIQLQTVDQQAPEEKPIVEDDNSFDSWSDFRSSSNAVNNKIPSPTVASVNNMISEDFSSQAWSDFPSSMFQARQEDTSGKKVSEHDIAKHDDLFNSWGSFNTSSVSQSNRLQNSETSISQSDDFFNGWSSRLTSSKDAVDNYQKMGGTSVPDITTSEDAWSDFTSSTNLPVNQLQSVKESQVDLKQAVTQDDPFDAWDLLMSSSGLQSHDKNVSSGEHVYQTSLLNSSGNVKIGGINSTSQSVFFPENATDRNDSANLGISSAEVLDSFRTKDGNAKSDIHTEQPQKDETGSVQTSGEKPIDAEMLLSQMHDLSFMLESSLSIPRKILEPQESLIGASWVYREVIRV